MNARQFWRGVWAELTGAGEQRRTAARHRAEVLAEVTARLRRTPRDDPNYTQLLRAARVIEGWTDAPASRAEPNPTCHED